MTVRKFLLGAGAAGMFLGGGFLAFNCAVHLVAGDAGSPKFWTRLIEAMAAIFWGYQCLLDMRRSKPKY
jgi:hypothetical protein